MAARARMTAVSSRSGRPPRAARAVTRLIRPLTSANGSPTRRATSIASSARAPHRARPKHLELRAAGERTRKRGRLRQAGQQRHRVVGGPRSPRSSAAGEPANAREPARVHRLERSWISNTTGRGRSPRRGAPTTRSDRGFRHVAAARARRARRAPDRASTASASARPRTGRWPTEAPRLAIAASPASSSSWNACAASAGSSSPYPIASSRSDRRRSRRSHPPAGAAAFDPLGDGPV